MLNRPVAPALLLLSLMASSLPLGATAWAQTSSFSSVPNNPATPTPSSTLSAAAASGQATAPAVSGNSLTLKLADFGDTDPYRLKTVRTERTYYFTRPKNWQVQPSSAVDVKFQHSASLLPERSSLNVLVNNRILKTIPLSKANVGGGLEHIAVPPDILKDRNTLTFQVDQHYTYQCEDPFSEELWTTLLPDTQLKLNYSLKPFQPELARLPYPFFDELGYGESKVGFVAPVGLADGSKTALATLAAAMGAAIDWRPAKTSLLNEGNWRSANQNIVMVGMPSENSAIAAVSGLPIAPQGNGFSTLPDGRGIDATDGIVQLVPHPGFAHRAVLVISGNTAEGVKKAAQFVASNPTNKLAAGSFVVVKSFVPTKQNLYRRWDGFVQGNHATFAQLNLPTLSTRGVTALPLHYVLKRMPDLYFPSKAKVKLTTHYSYASQLDGQMSKLEVKLNGKTVSSVPLSNPNGATNATQTIEIPAEDFLTYNDLDYQFYTFPEKMDLCRFVTDVHIWGTLHSSTEVEFPAEVKTPLPDVGLINDGGFPFTEVPDFSELAIVMPANPTAAEQNTLVQVMTRLGRAVPYKGRQLPEVVTAKSLSGDIKNNRHLIVVGKNALKELGIEDKSKYQLVIKNRLAYLSPTEKSLTTIQHDDNQGVLEEALSPYNDQRVMLLAYGENETAQQRVADLLASDKAFAAVGVGNLAVINADLQPQTVVAMKRGDARLMVDRNKQPNALPTWLVYVGGFLALLGLMNVLGALFRPRRR